MVRRRGLAADPRRAAGRHRFYPGRPRPAAGGQGAGRPGRHHRHRHGARTRPTGWPRPPSAWRRSAPRPGCRTSCSKTWRWLRPWLATRAANEGIGALPGRDLVTADEPDSTAEAVLARWPTRTVLPLWARPVAASSSRAGPGRPISTSSRRPSWRRRTIGSGPASRRWRHHRASPPARPEAVKSQPQAPARAGRRRRPARHTDVPSPTARGNRRRGRCRRWRPWWPAPACRSSTGAARRRRVPPLCTAVQPDSRPIATSPRDSPRILVSDTAGKRGRIGQLSYENIPVKRSAPRAIVKSRCGCGTSRSARWSSRRGRSRRPALLELGQDRLGQLLAQLDAPLVEAS